MCRNTFKIELMCRLAPLARRSIAAMRTVCPDVSLPSSCQSQSLLRFKCNALGEGVTVSPEQVSAEILRWSTNTLGLKPLPFNKTFFRQFLKHRRQKRTIAKFSGEIFGTHPILKHFMVFALKWPSLKCSLCINRCMFYVCRTVFEKCPVFSTDISPMLSRSCLSHNHAVLSSLREFQFFFSTVARILPKVYFY